MNNTIKTLLRGIIIALMPTALYVVLPGKSALLHVAYAATLVAVVMMVLSSLVLTRRNVRLPQDAVFSLLAWSYLGRNLLLSAVVIGLDAGTYWSAPWPLFCVAHALLLGWFILRILTLSAGKEHIDQVEDAVALKVTDWRLILADLDAIKTRLPVRLPDREQALKELQTLCEAFRYSDPMSKPSLAEMDAAFKAEISALGVAVDQGGTQEISAHCLKLMQRLKDRNNRVKAFK